MVSLMWLSNPLVSMMLLSNPPWSHGFLDVTEQPTMVSWFPWCYWATHHVPMVSMMLLSNPLWFMDSLMLLGNPPRFMVFLMLLSNPPWSHGFLDVTKHYPLNAHTSISFDFLYKRGFSILFWPDSRYPADYLCRIYCVRKKFCW